MKLLFGNNKHSTSPAGVVAAIGNFDGVHLGHQALLKCLREQAQLQQLPAAVVLFEPQPGEFFRGSASPARLSSLREKLAIVAESSVDEVYCLRFNEALASMPAEDFAKQVLFSQLNVKWLLVGQDFRFGKNRVGDVTLLVEIGRQLACQVAVFPDFNVNQQRVSSTAIRQALAKAKLQEAASLLGRPYAVCGRVVQGQQLGRQWGVPTANIRISRLNSPLQGIFCVRVRRICDGLILQGVASIGTRPTLGGGGEVILEVHLFDFNEEVYGELLQVSFLHQLRDEIKFASIDELVHQIFHDIRAAKAYFESKQPWQSIKTL